MTSSLLDYITSSALSLTVSGNTGISPFMTLLLLGIAEISDPSLLNMGNAMEAILGSWYSIVILSILTLLEIIGKCIPALDQFIDSVEVFVVPGLSILGTIGTFGVFDSIVANETTENNGEMLPTDEEGRRLGEFGEAWLTALKVILVIWGMGLALLIHFFKMILRISGLILCMGCCQPCITVLEITVVCFSVLFAIFIRQIAVVLCIVLLLAAAYTIKVKVCTPKDEEEGQSDNISTEQPKPSTTELPAKTIMDDNGDNAGESPPDVENPLPNVPSSKQNNGGNITSSHIKSDIPQPIALPSNPPATKIVSIAEMTPMSPPPASNPNYVADQQAPVAIAVPVMYEDYNERQMSMSDQNEKSTNLPKPKDTAQRKGNSTTNKEGKEKPKDSAVVY
jgi:hypothetical protein